jgi:hypothetical protein
MFSSSSVPGLNQETPTTYCCVGQALSGFMSSLSSLFLQWSWMPSSEYQVSLTLGYFQTSWTNSDGGLAWQGWLDLSVNHALLLGSYSLTSLSLRELSN